MLRLGERKDSRQAIRGVPAGVRLFIWVLVLIDVWSNREAGW